MINLICQRLPSFFLGVFGWLWLVSGAMAQHAVITADQTQINLDSELRYWAALGPNPGPAFEAFQNGEFTNERRTASHGINHAPEIWFGATLENASFDDGRIGDSFTLILDSPLNIGFRLFLVRADGLTETLVDYSAFQPFDAGQHSVTRLKSSAFVLAPGEEVTVLAHLQLGVMPGFSATLFRPEALSEASFGWGVIITAFYAFSLCVLLLGFGIQVAMRSWLGIGYVVMFVLFLMLIAYSDNLLFRVLYPNRPSLHLPIGLGLLVSVALTGLGTMMWSLLSNPQLRGGVLQKGALALIVLSVVTFFAYLWLQAYGLIYLAFTLVVLSLGLNAFLPEEVSQSDSSPNVGIRTVLLLITSIVVIIFVCVLFVAPGWITTGSLFKISFLMVSLTVMTFMTGNLVVLRKRYVKAVETRLAVMEEQTEKNRQLLETERAYNRARETAAARQRQLATASHDIKQPLMSLRTTFDAISTDMDQTVRDRLQNAFLYLEDLSKSYVDRAGGADVAEELNIDDAEEPSIEAYSLSVPLQTVQQMFKEEAVSKGLYLRVVETTVETTAPPIVLMRILTNLVSNAVKNTDTGGVVIGLRRSTRSICVYDSGVGMSAEELDAFQQAYMKGEASTGHGLGLSVCFELAEKNAMPLTVRSQTGRATAFSVSLASHLVVAPR
ncbi:sensor histidine kinase [Planktotalea sp.]|uniref:sensor histidine kinase n=1 Tax=Planktotalea sp. TaxID=2029877 RepID=UPI003D6AB503